MRIIGGEWKGRTIKVDKSFTGRPTTDFAKEALFNVLQHLVEWDDVSLMWDLFAGTGAISLEAASRGVQRVIAVESSPKHSRHLQQVKRDFQADGMDIFTADVRTFLGRQTDLPQVVFADPPYDLPWLKELPVLIFEKKSDQLQLLIIEHGKDIKFEDSPYFWQARSYGHVHFSFFKIENK